MFSLRYGLPADHLWISVYEDDDEAFAIWNKEVSQKRLHHNCTFNEIYIFMYGSFMQYFWQLQIELYLFAKSAL